MNNPKITAKPTPPTKDAQPKKKIYICVLPSGKQVEIRAIDPEKARLTCKMEHNLYPVDVSRKPFDRNLTHRPFAGLNSAMHGSEKK